MTALAIVLLGAMLYIAADIVAEAIRELADAVRGRSDDVEPPR